MTIAEPHLAGLSDEHRRVLELWLVEFDEAWEDSRLAAWMRKLPPAGDPLRRPALIEMVKIDLERRWQHNKRVSLESYLKSLPELGTPDSVPVDLIVAECEVRQQFKVPVDMAALAKRFPRRTEELRRLVKPYSTVGPEMPPTPANRERVAPSSAMPLPGQPVAAAAAGSLPEQFGRYRIIRQLGHGGMGTVYLAYDSILEREVALKVPHFAPDDGPEILERFYSEARAAATLTHPNICPVHEVGEINATHYLTMAYIEGKPLSEFIDVDKPLPQRQVAALVRKLALALHEAHARAVIHRDLKPSNIMVDQRREPVIMDFGLARRVRNEDVRLTKSGTPLGTPAYMPPEQIAGDVRAMGPGCDIYSLGVILYELLTGRLPFEGPLVAVWGQILTQDPPRPAEHRSDLDPRLEAVCLKAMAKKAEHRFASMAEFAAALEDYLGQSPSKVRPTTIPRWLRVVAATIAALWLFLGIAVVIHNWSASKPHSEQDTPREEYGSLQIALDDPLAEVEVQIDEQRIAITQLARPLQLPPGEHDLRIAGPDVEPVRRRFNVQSGKNPTLTVPLELRTGELRQFEGHLAPVWCVAFSPDGRQALSGSGGSAEAKDGKDVFQMEGTDHTMRLWDVATGRKLREFVGHKSAVGCVAFSSDGHRALSASFDKTVRRWDLDSGQELHCFKDMLTLCATFSADGRRALSDTGFSLRLWDMPSGKELRRLENNTWFLSVALSLDGRRAVSANMDGTACLWDIAAQKEIHRFSGTHGLTRMAFSPNSQLIASAGNDNLVRLWDAESGIQLQTFPGHTGPAWSVAFSPDGKRILSGSYDRTMRLWDVETGKQLRRFDGHTFTVASVAFSPDGRRALSTSFDKTLRLWGLPK